MNFDFIKEFEKKVSELQVDWEVKGLVSAKSIFSMGSDSRIVARIFELLSAPIIVEIAKENGYKVEIPEKQNTYPDFTLIKNGRMIAIDIKSTFRYYYKRKEGYKKFRFTLGSYASFLRNNTKNIAHDYRCYDKHYVIGFLYDRNPDATEEVFDKTEYDKIQASYQNVEYFVQEKYKISGEKPATGNTENIGTFKTKDINFLREGSGPFSVLGNDIFEEYWRQYPRYKNRKKKGCFQEIEAFLKRKYPGEPLRKYKDWYNKHKDTDMEEI